MARFSEKAEEVTIPLGAHRSAQTQEMRARDRSCRCSFDWHRLPSSLDLAQNAARLSSQDKWLGRLIALPNVSSDCLNQLRKNLEDPPPNPPICDLRKKPFHQIQP